MADDQQASLEARVRDFLRNIPRNKNDYVATGSVSSTGPSVIDNERTNLQSADIDIPQNLAAPAVDRIGGAMEVASYDETSGTYPEDVEGVTKISFEMTDADEIDHLTVFDNGGGEVLVQFPTTEITGAVSGVPSTNVICIDGTGWQPI